MHEIISSAAKIVFIMMALTACVAYLIGLMEVKDFMYLTAMAFTFYFSNKGDADSRYLGK